MPCLAVTTVRSHLLRCKGRLPTPIFHSQRGSNSESLRLDKVKGRGCLFQNDGNLNIKSAMIDFTVTNACRQ